MEFLSAWLKASFNVRAYIITPAFFAMNAPKVIITFPTVKASTNLGRDESRIFIHVFMQSATVIRWAP